MLDRGCEAASGCKQNKFEIISTSREEEEASQPQDLEAAATAAAKLAKKQL